MHILEPRPDELNQKEPQAAESRFFYIPEDPNEGIGSRIFNTTTTFLEHYRQVLPTKPIVPAQVYVTPEGELQPVDTMSNLRPIVTVRFSGQNIYTHNDVWQLVVCSCESREEYSLQTQGGLYFEKRSYDRQGVLTELALVRDVLPVWEVIDTVLSSEVAAKNLKELGSNKPVDADIRLASRWLALHAANKRIPGPPKEAKEKTLEDIRLEVKAFLASLDEAISTSRQANQELYRLFPSDEIYYDYQSAFYLLLDRARGGIPLTSSLKQLFGYIENLQYLAGIESDKMSMLQCYARHLAGAQILGMIRQCQAPSLEVGGTIYASYNHPLLREPVLCRVDQHKKSLFTDCLPPHKAGLQLAGINEKRRLLEDWLSLDEPILV